MVRLALPVGKSALPPKSISTRALAASLPWPLLALNETALPLHDTGAVPPPPPTPPAPPVPPVPPLPASAEPPVPAAVLPPRVAVPAKPPAAGEPPPDTPATPPLPANGTVPADPATAGMWLGSLEQL